jgi:hypothetical protein
MASGFKILNGVSDWIRNSVGPEAQNRADDETVEDEETADAEDDDTSGESDDYDAPACCSAASSTDVTVLDP